MTHFSVTKTLQELADKDSSFGRLRFTAREPILLSNGPKQTQPVWKLFGIYLLVERNGEDWNIPLASFDGKLLYIGKTATSIHERIKSHFGLANMESSFNNHRWRSVKHVSPDLQERLGVGDVVLYCVGVDSEAADLPKGQHNLLPEITEKHLLLSYVLSSGKLPILNLQL